MSLFKYSLLPWLLIVVFTSTSCRKSAASYREAADRFLAEKKFSDAALNYRNAIQKEPNSPQALFGLGLAELNQSNFRPAREAFSRAINLKSDYREAMVSLAEINLFLFSEDPRRPPALYEQAVKLIDRLATMSPNDFDTLRLRGQIAQLDQRAAQAVDLFEKANALKPFDRRVTMPLTQSLLAANRAADAEKFADSVLAKDPEFPPIYDLLYRHYIVSNRAPEAEKILQRKVRALPNQAEPRVQLAGFYATGNLQTEAEAALKPLFDRIKEFPDANLRVSEMFLSIKQPDRAMHYLEEGLRSDAPRKATYLKRLAALTWAKNDRKKAIEYARAAVEAAPDDDEARRFRGSFLLQAGTRDDLAVAIDDYSYLLRKNPKDKVLNTQLGNAYRAKGDRESAWKYFQTAIQNSPSYLAPRLSLAELSSDQRNSEQTLRYLDEILSIDKDNAQIRLFRAGTLRNLNRLPEARKEVQALLAAQPGNADTQIESGLLYLAEGRPSEAELVFLKLYQADPTDARRIMGLAEAYAVKKEFPKAIKLLEAELQKAPKGVGPHIALARMLARSGDMKAALGHYQQLIAADSTVGLFHLETGQLLLAQGNTALAVESLQKASAISPKDAVIQYNLATALHAARRLDDARKQYQQALAIDADNPDLLNNFAFLCAEQGTDLERGVDLAQKAVAKDSDNPNYSDTLGLLYLKQNNVDRALQVLRPVVSKHPDNASFRLHLAMALSKKGLHSDAKQELQTALTKQPSSEDAAAIRELLAKIGG